MGAKVTMRNFNAGFSSSFPGARGAPLSRHVAPMGGCAERRLELCRAGGAPLCRLVWPRISQLVSVGARNRTGSRGEAGIFYAEGRGARRWLGYGIAGLGDGQKGRDGGPDAVLRRWAAFTQE